MPSACVGQMRRRKTTVCLRHICQFVHLQTKRHNVFLFYENCSQKRRKVWRFGNVAKINLNLQIGFQFNMNLQFVLWTKSKVASFWNIKADKRPKRIKSTNTHNSILLWLELRNNEMSPTGARFQLDQCAAFAWSLGHAECYGSCGVANANLVSLLESPIGAKQ